MTFKNVFYASIWTTETELSTELVLSTQRVQGLKFDSRLNGGFGTASFSVAYPRLEASQMYRTLIGNHLVIFDWLGDVVWEGRINDTEVSGNSIKLKAYGYYASSSQTAGPSVFLSTDTARDIIEFMVDLATDWRDDFSYLGEDDLVEVGPLEFERTDKIYDAITEVTKYGYLDTLNTVARRRPLYFAIWEQRKAYLFPEPDPAGEDPKWIFSMEDFKDGEQLKLSLSLSNIKNKIWVAYNDQYLDGVSTLDAVEELNSQGLFGVREGTMSLGNVKLETAEIVRDLLIKYNAFPKMKATTSIIGNPKTPSGMVWPLHKVRAGDMIMINDFDGSIAQLTDGSAGQTAMYAFVSKASYNADAHSLMVTLGSAQETIDLLLNRLGVSPGGLS